ncbi:MAG: hypothetical protein L3J39_00755 [Verrucomicrobiales bacterium]|nr:hypothetical protein [Verrucomicrobiales bacterium]
MQHNINKTEPQLSSKQSSLNKPLLFGTFFLQYTFVTLSGILLFLDYPIIWFPPMVIAYIIPSIIPGDLGIPMEAQQQAMTQRPFIVRALVSLSVVVIAIASINIQLHSIIPFNIPVKLKWAFLFFAFAFALSDFFLAKNCLAYNRKYQQIKTP